jgi:hypothetical protein
LPAGDSPDRLSVPLYFMIFMSFMVRRALREYLRLIGGP